jgi:hypothetical protein
LRALGSELELPYGSTSSKMLQLRLGMRPGGGLPVHLMGSLGSSPPVTSYFNTGKLQDEREDDEHSSPLGTLQMAHLHAALVRKNLTVQK